VAAASKAVSTKELPIPVVTTGRGRFIATDPILFNSGVSMLREASIPELDKVARLLKQNPDIKLEIIGFSDNLGIEPANQKVSLDRAAAVMDYLVSQGIEPFRLKCRGMGSLYPMDTNETKLGRQANRRIELRIVEQGEKQESLREESQE
jgi:OOP family OmpA-OmpF porin